MLIILSDTIINITLFSITDDSTKINETYSQCMNASRAYR